MAYAKSTATCQRLIQSTAKLLRTRGYAATGLREILQESGVPKGSLYHHFPGGKEELAAASLRQAGDSIIAQLALLLDRTDDPAAATRAFCDAYIAQLESSGFRKGCPLATVALESAAEIDTVHEACSFAFGSITALLARHLEARGVDRRTAGDAAVYAVSAIEGALLLAKARRSASPVAVVRDRLAAHLRSIIDEGTEGGSP